MWQNLNFMKQNWDLLKFSVCPRLRFSSQIWIIWPKSFCYAYLRCYGIPLAKNIVKYFLLNKGFIPVCTVQWLMSFKDFVRQPKATPKTILNISIFWISTVNIISPVLELVSYEGHYFIKVQLHRLTRFLQLCKSSLTWL